MKKDFYGNQVQIGDLVLGAKPGGRYRITEFTESVVIDETDAMLRVCQIGDSRKLESSEQRIRDRGRRGGRLHPEEIIVIKKGYLTKERIRELEKLGENDRDSHVPNLLSHSIFP